MCGSAVGAPEVSTTIGAIKRFLCPLVRRKWREIHSALRIDHSRTCVCLLSESIVPRFWLPFEDVFLFIFEGWPTKCTPSFHFAT